MKSIEVILLMRLLYVVSIEIIVCRIYWDYCMLYLLRFLYVVSIEIIVCRNYWDYCMSYYEIIVCCIYWDYCISYLLRLLYVVSIEIIVCRIYWEGNLWTEPTFVLGRRSFHGHAYNVLAPKSTNYNKPEVSKVRI